KTRLFQSAQWFSLNLAAIAAGLTGSAICRRWVDSPPTALHVAALIAMCVPFVVATLTWWLVTDQRASLNLPEFKATGKALLHAFASRRLWLVVAFLFLINFNPGVVTALYDHLEHRIGLSNSYLAMLDTINSSGQVIGALVFMLAMSGRMSTRMAIVAGLIIG